jgi:ribonuclease-3
MLSTRETGGVETPQDFAARVSLEFHDIALLRRALTHSSYVNENSDAIEDNERLEFLGDAVLDFLVGAWLYNHYPEMREGELTRMRSALVRTDQLAEFARQMDLGNALRLGRGEEDGGGRRRNALLCGAFEALVGALFLDRDIDHVAQFIEPLLKPAAESIILARQEQDPKSLFQEWAQGLGYGPPHYKTISSSGPDHARTFEIEVWVNGTFFGRGSGNSKQAAAKSAARDALLKLEQL